MLCDATIVELLNSKTLTIEPWPSGSQIQPASVDLTLGDQFLSPYDDHVEQREGVYTIVPNECLLATTAERVELPAHIVGRVEGKSSWGRRFLMVHSTAGFIDPGFRGQITLELKNLSTMPILLTVGAPIAQISFQLLDRPAVKPYGSPGLNSHYQDQVGVTGSALPWA